MEDHLKEFDIDLTHMVYGGEAMGRLPDGRAVFVPYAIAGEKVRLRLVEEKRGYARAELLEVLEPSPGRIPPRCERPAACGGCHYQHIAYPMQLQIKTEILREQLERIGGLSDIPIQPIVPSPKMWNYRNHIQLHISPEGKLGFLEPRSNTVVPIEDCPLAEEPLDEIWRKLDIESIPGLERVGLRLGADEDILLVLAGSAPGAPEFSVEDLDISAVYTGPNGTMVLAGSDYLVMEISDRKYKVSAESFFQVNTLQAGAMVEHLLGNLLLDPGKDVLELYSGVGLFSAFISGKVKRLAAVESSPSAVNDFVENLDEFDNVEIYETQVEQVMAGLDIRPNVLLADPPRAGLGHRVVESIVSLGAPAFAYISCDPATLARDAKDLAKGGYTLEKITPFDLFPQTYHIESISFWRMGS
ncbi:MAG: class I SAM-dependent RNA methyltransferase [Chloroflexota bacterium]|nr:MAG: class I SAM-dependent RNA methyltransferase [Chloroflexota bacterium]